MKRQWFKDQRGSVLLFTTVMLIMLLVFGGIAIDLTYHGSVKRELQRSMDAASLAGAGNLGFDETVFPAARAAAQNYAAANGFSHYDPTSGNISLDLNTANNSNGDIVLGIWDGANFEPSQDGTRVNAVQCNYATTIPTSFLGLVPGLNNLQVSASAIAVTYPPAEIPPNTCVFPIALSCCAFGGCSTGTSSGCGAPVTFITSSGKDEDCIEPPCTNTASWANLCDSSTPSTPDTVAAVEAAASGECTECDSTSTPQIGTNNGMQQPVFDALEDAFLSQYGGTHEVTDSEGNTVYSGPGWKVYVPVIQTECPPQAINGAHDVVGWTEFVITGGVNHGTCFPSNPADPNFPVLCPDTGEPAMRAVFGYFKCTIVPSPPGPTPGPGPALATGLRLVR